VSTVHASAVLFAGTGVLIRGASGAGKSRLAHALIMRHGAELVADDRVALAEQDGALIARPPENLAGLLEVRGLGIVKFPHLSETRLGLVLDLLPEAEIPRMPDAGQSKIGLLGVTLPRAFAPSPESGLDVLLTIQGQSGASPGPAMGLASSAFDGKTERS
jgi:serine kinase of HPr protein (carbohydrate metabolism regulator)